MNIVFQKKTFKQYFKYFATFIIWSINRRYSQVIQEAKHFFNIFVDCSKVDAKLFFGSPTHGLIGKACTFDLVLSH